MSNWGKCLHNNRFNKLVLNLYVKRDLTIRDVAGQANVSLDTIYQVLKKNKIKTRRKEPYKNRETVNVDYFKSIDTEEKAYYLGLFDADGCVSKNNKGYFSSAINLTVEDSYLLDSLISAVYPDGKVFKTSAPYRDVRLGRKPFNVKASRGMYVYGEEFATNLISNGCVFRKTFNLRFPIASQVPDHLLHHFVRGYFDGDGCICRYGKNIIRASITFVSSKRFLKGLEAYLLENGIRSCTRPKTKAFQLTIARMIDVEKFYNLIYNRATIFLKRKRQKFIDHYGY